MAHAGSSQKGSELIRMLTITTTLSHQVFLNEPSNAKILKLLAVTMMTLLVSFAWTLSILMLMRMVVL